MTKTKFLQDYAVNIIIKQIYMIFKGKIIKLKPNSKGGKIVDQNRHLSIKVTYCSNSKNVEFTRKTEGFVITFKK